MKYWFIAIALFVGGWTSATLTDDEILKKFDELHYLFSSNQYDENVERCDVRYEICRLDDGKDCRAKQEKCTIDAYHKWMEIKKQRGW